MTGAGGFLAAVGGGGAGREGPGRPPSFLPSDGCRFVRVGGVGLLAVRGGEVCTHQIKGYIHCSFVRGCKTSGRIETVDLGKFDLVP